MNELAELKKSLKQQTYNCELAATMGQALVEENERLTSKMVNDQTFAKEIQDSLVNQSRQLKFQLLEETVARTDIETRVDGLEVELESVLDKNRKLRVRVEKLKDEKWSLLLKLQDRDITPIKTAIQDSSPAAPVETDIISDEMINEETNEAVELMEDRATEETIRDILENGTESIAEELERDNICPSFYEESPFTDNVPNIPIEMIQEILPARIQVADETLIETIVVSEHIKEAKEDIFEDSDFDDNKSRYSSIEYNRHSDVSYPSKLLSKDAINAVEALTLTMIGSWFQKYNRRDKNPQLRYCWVNPYSRTINWSASPPSEDSQVSSRSAFIASVQWRDKPLSRNFPPSEKNCIIISTGLRTLKLLPLSWDIHDQWVDGIGLLLKKTKNKVEVHEQFKMVQELRSEEVDRRKSTDTKSTMQSDLKGRTSLSSPSRNNTMRNLQGSVPFPIDSKESAFDKFLGTPRRLAKRMLTHTNKPLL